MTPQALHAIRQQLGLSSDEMAELLGCANRMVIWRYENAKNPIPRPVAKLARIAARKGVRWVEKHAAS